MSFQLEYDLDGTLKRPYNQVPLAVKLGRPLTKKEELRHPQEEIWVCINYLYKFHFYFVLKEERMECGKMLVCLMFTIHD